MSDLHHHPDRPPIPPLTSLRFFAAALVVIYHYDANRFTRLPEFVRNWFETGYEAVTFFFLLSGFVLAYVYHRTDRSGPVIDSLSSFFTARFARLFPALYVSLLVALPFFVAPGLFDEDDRLSPRVVVEGVLVLTGLQAWWPAAALAWNPPAWSVSVEWFMYLTFPLILLAMRHLSAGLMLVSAFALVVAVALLRVAIMDAPRGVDPDLWYNFTHFFPLFHLPQFILGAALGRAYLEGPRLAPALAAWMFAAGTLGLLILLFELDGLPLRIRSNAVLVIFFTLIIYGAAQPGHAAYRLLSRQPFLQLGNISYSMYALHQPLEYWWDWGGPREWGLRLPALSDFLIYFAIVVVLSALCYRYVEVPMRRWIRSTVSSRA